MFIKDLGGKYNKKIIPFLTLTIIFVCTANAKAERAAGSICEPRVPAISFDQAIEIANKYISSQKITLNKNFIDYVSLECKKNVHYWVVGYRVKEHETGHYIVYVYMDSSTKATVVKDG